MEFSLHTYLNRLRTRGASDEFVEIIRRHAKPLSDRGLPVILSLGHLAFATSNSHEVLHGIVKREVDPYRGFWIRKRSGGKRYICVPEGGLIRTQRWIHDHILCSTWGKKSLSMAATAYVPGSSHIDNAKRHSGADCVLKLDITNFFETISERQVYHVFHGFGYRPLVAFYFSRLCTRVLDPKHDVRSPTVRWAGKKKRWQTEANRKNNNYHTVGHLPQGAPTSPMLANLVCFGLDLELQQIADSINLVYTRYADDMTFSGSFTTKEQISQFICQVSAVVGKFGFSINQQKTSLSRTGGRKIVTGLSVEGDALRLPRAYKDAIRQELYYIERYGLSGHLERVGYANHLTYLMRLKGRIQYWFSIEPATATPSIEQFRAIFPNFNEINELVTGDSSRGIPGTPY
ncbi:MAG: RNA-directed DNA polymerase [Magnetococcales bacterium]|nr:RNA-directed DNA polymerase [Magnetococcales bacterium]